MTEVMRVNHTILDSIPLDKGLKRYLVKWFEGMCKANGTVFAVARVKALRELMMAYIADPNRLKAQSSYFSRAPIRVNGRLKQLFQYAETQPRAVLALLKFYLGEAETVTTVEEAQLKQHKLLSDLAVDSSTYPSQLTLWLNVLLMSPRERTSLYFSSRKHKEAPYHYVCLHHSVQEWLGYWRQWYGRLIKHGASCLVKGHYTPADVSLTVTPVPSMYADYLDCYSQQFEDDAHEFLGYFPDANGGEEYVPVDLLEYCMSGWEPSRIFNVFELDDIIDDGNIDERVVGRIHHIPKKGTVERRSIAVPNRFLQAGLKPYQLFLYDGLRVLPRDHTFDQGKSAQYVKRRIDKHRYVSSVDLSHATDYLPYSLGELITHFVWDAILVECSRLMPSLSSEKRQQLKNNLESVSTSSVLFDWVRQQKWQNGVYKDTWKVGQPLGTFPSFGMLAWTHNILAESLALAGGYLHSPYTVLGDDFLCFSKRMRKMYVKVMEDLGVPLSYHKSYEHRLAEFAGMVLIEGQPVGYTPDPNKVTWYNLFDYSRNSGFLLSYRALPSKLRKRLTKEATKVALSGERLYRLAAEFYFAEYGSPYSSYMDETMGLLPILFSLDEDNNLAAEPEVTSGWNLLSFNGEEKLAFTGRGLKRVHSTPEWLKRKLKPATTDAILRRAQRVVRLASQDRHERNACV
jgi:hypothetical protein